MAAKPIYEHIVEMDHLEKTSSHQRPLPALAPTSFGKPGRKPHVDIVDPLALLVSVVCLIAAICTISPLLNIAWHLGYTYQIIVIGFLLSIMNLCLGRVSSALFFMVEARFGTSTLQNYEAILRNQPLSTMPVSLHWRTTLLLFIALPLGLSAGYKRFTGGTARALIPEGDIPSNMYGTTALPGLNNLGTSIGYAELVNASLPFMIASQHDDTFPSTLPQTYGQNTLLISNTTAAFLDMPMPDLVTSIQQSLVTGETRTISATVHVFVTTHNQSVEQHRNDTAYWDRYLDGSDRLNQINLFEGYEVYTLMNNYLGIQDASWCFVAMYNASASFAQTALRFDTYRHSCQATWDISTQSMNLVQASCDVEPIPPINQEVITESQLAIGYWYTTILADNIGKFLGGRVVSPWRLPTYVVSVAAMYWARTSALHGPSGDGALASVADNTYPFPELYYSAHDQVVYSKKPTVDAKWPLYCILVLQPLLTIVILTLKAFFHSVPIGEGFGLIAILAGVNKQSLHLLEGAALTGQLKKPVRLALGVCDDCHDRFTDEPKRRSQGSIQDAGRIQFIVDGQERNRKLTPGLLYS